MALPINCDCFRPSSGLYNSSFCLTQRLNTPITPPQCVSVAAPTVNIPTSLSSNSGGMAGFSLTNDPVANSAVSRQRGQGWATITSGFLSGLSNVFGGGAQQQQQQPQTVQAGVQPTSQPTSQGTGRGWIPFAVIGGLAVVGVLGYFALKNRK